MSDTQIESLGHNSVAAGRLKDFLERIENLEDDKANIQGDLKEVYLELKGEGFDVTVMRKIVALRKQDRAKRLEKQSLLELYVHAMGLDLV